MGESGAKIFGPGVKIGGSGAKIEALGQRFGAPVPIVGVSGS